MNSMSNESVRHGQGWLDKFFKLSQHGRMCVPRFLRA